MGSQNVTDFSKAKKKRLRHLMREYASQPPREEENAWLVGAAAVGRITGTSSFVQSLSSPGVEVAYQSLSSLADDLKQTRDPQDALQKYGVRRGVQRPVAALAAALVKSLSERLTAQQEGTDAAFAAKDALTQTLLDVIRKAFPGIREPAEAKSKEVAQAFRKIPESDIALLFLNNVSSSLINLVLDSVRGPVPPAQAAELKARVRDQFIPDLLRLLTGTRKKL